MVISKQKLNFILDAPLTFSKGLTPPQHFRYMSPMEKPCDIATGDKTKGGYIRAKRIVNGKKKNIRLHREAWEKAYGPIPNGLFVLHHCDTPACREPTHLFLGTHQDNADDRVSKGRQATGETVGTSNLSEERVRQIRRAEGTNKEIADRFGLSPSHIYKIRNRISWKHLP